MKRTYAVVMSCLLTLMGAQHAGAADADESEQNALLLTQILESEGDLSHPPEFFAEDRTVRAVIDGSPMEARQTCLAIEAMVERNQLVFAEGWTAEVLTDDSDGEVMASCPL